MERGKGVVVFVRDGYERRRHRLEPPLWQLFVVFPGRACGVRRRDWRRNEIEAHEVLTAPP